MTENTTQSVLSNSGSSSNESNSSSSSNVSSKKVTEVMPGHDDSKVPSGWKKWYTGQDGTVYFIYSNDDEYREDGTYMGKNEYNY